MTKHSVTPPDGRRPLHNTGKKTGNSESSPEQSKGASKLQNEKTNYQEKPQSSSEEMKLENEKPGLKIDISKIVLGIISVVSLLLSCYMYITVSGLNSPEYHIIKEVIRDVCQQSEDGGDLNQISCVKKIKMKFQDDYFSKNFSDLAKRDNEIISQIDEMFSASKNSSGVLQQFTFGEVEKVKKIIAANDEFDFINSFPKIQEMTSKLQFFTQEEGNIQELETLVRSSKETQFFNMLKIWNPDRNDIHELKRWIDLCKDNKFNDEIPMVIKSHRLIEEWKVDSVDLNELALLAKSSKDNRLLDEIPHFIFTKNKLLKWNIEENSLTELSHWANVSKQFNFSSSLPQLNKVFPFLIEWNPQTADIDTLKNLPEVVQDQFNHLAANQEKYISERMDEISVSQNKKDLLDEFNSDDIKTLRSWITENENYRFIESLPEIMNVNSKLQFLMQEDNISELKTLVRNSQETKFAENLNVIKKMSDRLKDWQIEKRELEELKNLAVSSEKNDLIKLIESSKSSFINVTSLENKNDEALHVQETIEEIYKDLDNVNSQLYLSFEKKIREIFTEKTGHNRSGYSLHFSEVEIDYLKLFTQNMSKNNDLFSKGGPLDKLQLWNPSLEELQNISKWIKLDSETNFSTSLHQVIAIFKNLTSVNLKSEEYIALKDFIRASEKTSLLKLLPGFVKNIPELTRFVSIIPILEQWNPNTNDIDELKRWIIVNKNINFTDKLPEVINSIKLLGEWNPDHQNLEELTSLANTSRKNNLVSIVPELISLKNKFLEWNVDKSSLTELSHWAKLSEEHQIREIFPFAMKSYKTWKKWDPSDENLHELTLLAEVSRSNSLVNAVSGLLSVKNKFENWNIEGSYLPELTEWARTSKKYKYVEFFPSLNELFATLKDWNPQTTVLNELTKWAGVTLRNNYADDLSVMRHIFQSLRKWNPSLAVLEELSKWADVSRNHRFVSSLPTFRDSTDEQLLNLKGTTSTLESKLIKLENHVYDLRAKDDMKSGNLSSGTLLAVAVIISLACIIITFILWNQHAENRFQPAMPAGAFIKPIPRSLTPPIDEGDIIKPRHSILDEITARPLQKKICMISFYRETQKAHELMLEPVITGGRMQNLSLNHVVINKHEQIKSLPAAMVYLVFVDYNQRHVILENPDLGLGDLRLITVRAAKKIGGEVILFYVGDEGSRNLTSRSLFNTNLTSIFQHEELKILQSGERVISAYQTLTNYQEQHVRNFMRNILF